MAISRLIVEKFRNLNAVDLEFDHGFNFLVGNNGSGKTSLLEAIFYLGHGRSFKSAVANRIISYDEPHFHAFWPNSRKPASMVCWLTKTPPRQYHRKNKR